MLGVFSPRESQICLDAAVESTIGGWYRVIANFGPFWRRDFSAGDRGFLDKL